MADRDDYRELLGQRLEAAHKASTHIKEEPSGKEVLGWIETAKRRKRKQRMRMISSMAAVFAVVLCVGVVVVIGPPEAEAGGKGGVDISYIQSQDGYFEVEKYTSMENLPEKIKDTYIMFYSLPEGFEVSEIRVMQAKQDQRCVIDIRQEENLVRIKQFSSAENSMSEAIVREGEKETWGEIDVYISIYEYQKEQIAYFLEHEGIIMHITCSADIPRESIKNMVQEAIG